MTTVGMRVEEVQHKLCQHINKWCQVILIARIVAKLLHSIVCQCIIMGIESSNLLASRVFSPMPKLPLWLRLITIVHLAHNSSIIAVWRSQKHTMRLSTSQCFQHHENPPWTAYYFGYRMFPILAISVTSPWNVHTWPNWVSSAMRIIPLAKNNTFQAIPN